MAKPTAIIPSPLLPSPPTNLADLLTSKVWPKAQRIHRIHDDVYGHDEFNPGKGNARFSDLR